MSAYVIVVIVAAVMALFSAVSGYFKASWSAEPLISYGVPRSWWPWLSTAKLAGGLGLLAGLWIPPLGVAAGIGLALYFVGAVITVIRAGKYAHVPFPMLYGAPVVGALLLGMTG